MRVKPSLLTGILVLLGYLAVVFTVWIIAGVDYDEVGDTVDNVRNVIAMSMIVGAVYVAVVTSVLGWWKPSMREPRRADHHKWMWIIPILLTVGVVVNLASTKWGEIDQLGTYVMWLVIGCIGVGFNEEMITRATLIVAARGTLHEGWVWFVSSLGLRAAPRPQRLLRPEREGHGAAGLLRLRHRHRLLRHPPHHRRAGRHDGPARRLGLLDRSSRATRSTSSPTSRWRSAGS